MSIVFYEIKNKKSYKTIIDDLLRIVSAKVLIDYINSKSNKTSDNDDDDDDDDHNDNIDKDFYNMRIVNWFNKDMTPEEFNEIKEYFDPKYLNKYVNSYTNALYFGLLWSEIPEKKRMYWVNKYHKLTSI